MLKIGLTGGIGSGKSIVSRLFELLGIPVLDADRTAKDLMENDPALADALRQEFGGQVFENDRLNRSFLASLVFRDPEKLRRLNQLVHPFVIDYANDWMQRQQAPYLIKEAALFFETGSYRAMDKMIGVSAPQELRIRRILQRDRISRQEIHDRMSRQMDEAAKMKRCDYIIDNDERHSLIAQVLQLHRTFTANS